jgi:hypothetical protein
MTVSPMHGQAGRTVGEDDQEQHAHIELLVDAGDALEVKLDPYFGVQPRHADLQTRAVLSSSMSSTVIHTDSLYMYKAERSEAERQHGPRRRGPPTASARRSPTARLSRRPACPSPAVGRRV